MRPCLLVRVLPCFALATPAAAQQAWTVDDDGPADFAELQAAVDAAAPGDAIFVEPGVYAPIDVDKGLDLVLDSGVRLEHVGFPGLVAGTPVVHIHDLPADQGVTLTGGFVENDRFSAGAIHVEDCAGAVWLQQVFVQSLGATALHASNAASLVTVFGGYRTLRTPTLADGSSPPLPGALFADGTRAFVHESSFSGSFGALYIGLPAPAQAQNGGAGAIVRDSTVRFVDSSLRGGTGRAHPVSGCVEGGDGGPGILVEGPTSRVEFSEVTATGGNASQHDAGCATAPLPGPPTRVEAGALQELLDVPRELFAFTSPFFPGSFQLSIQAQPNDHVLLLASDSLAPVTSLLGLDLHLDLGSTFLAASFPTTSGFVSIAPFIPPQPQPLRLTLQAVLIDTDGGLHATGPAAVVLR